MQSSRISRTPNVQAELCIQVCQSDSPLSHPTNIYIRKHMDKHLRPYKCHVPTCTVNSFATAGDLKRHEREVHSTPVHNCPITTCKRNRRGFSRKDNLVQHMSRTHDQVQDMGTSIASSSSSPPVLAFGNESVPGEAFTVQDSVGSNGNLESTECGTFEVNFGQ